MGFRNPITSATDVDTGHGLADAGVRLYQDTSNPAVPQGVAEWRTGSMDRNATVKISGGASGGSSFTVYGGRSQLTDAPTVALNVEGLPAGGYGPVLRLQAGAGGQIITDTAVADLIPKTVFPAGAYPNPTLFGPWGSTAYDDAYYQLDADGYVTLGGLVKNKVAGGWAPGTALVQLPAGCRPARNHLLQALTQQSAYGEVILQVDPLGNVNYISAVPGWSWVANQFVALDGIRFRAEQ